MSDFERIVNKIKNANDRKLLSQVHKKILFLGKGVGYRIFPIYIRYTKGNNTIAILYYDKKHFLDLGLNISKEVIGPKFQDAAYMKYPDISYSIKVKNISDLDNKVINFLKKL